MKFKTFLSTVILLILSVSLIACGSSKNPEDTIKSFFETYKSAKLEEAEAFIENSEGMLIGMKTDDNNADNKFIIETLTSKFNYKIDNVSVDGNTAVISVEMTNVDMEEAMSSVIMGLFSSLGDGSTSEDDIDTKLSQLLEEHLNSENIVNVTNIVDINLNKYDNNWKIVGDIPLYDGLTGNFVSYTSSMSNAFENLED